MAIAFLLAGVLAPAAAALQRAGETQYSWQRPHAQVLPRGDLDWRPEPFEFRSAGEVRYIDFANGDDAGPGTKAHPWKHHPWDGNATGAAAAGDGLGTYVFKGGVTYRGALSGKAEGRVDRPVRLTRDPNWGEGPAVIAGSAALTGGWQKAGPEQAPEGMPEPGKVWYRDLKQTPRPWTMWMVEGDAVTRLPLARTPNWREPEGDDMHAEWWAWQSGRAGITDQVIAGREEMNYGTDPEHLTLPAEAYEQAFLYTEWGPVMGTPTARPVLEFDEKTHTVYFEGFWGGRGQKIFGGNRYFLENSPYFLDHGGEWWYADEGRFKGRLYVRLPGDRNPNRAHLEVGRRKVLIEIAGGSRHLEISGLDFRFTNVGKPSGAFSPEIYVSCVRLLGGGEHIRVANNGFKRVNMAVRMTATGPGERLSGVLVTDNDIAYTDHGGVRIRAERQRGSKVFTAGVLGEVKVLRNRMYRVGRRPARPRHGMALAVSYAEFLEVAGNILRRCYGAGIFLHGGKGGGNLVGDVPVNRTLVHHNKVVDALLNTNDWGEIETWQGGPFYVYNNLAGNPVGYWHWARRRFAFAYYLDGSFKNYLFNNIAWGNSSDPDDPHGNTSGMQEIIGFQNAWFNNTVFRFVTASRRQAPMAGRNYYLGNLFQNIGSAYFYHSQAKQETAEANAADAARAGPDYLPYEYHSLAYAGNVVQGSPDYFGKFEHTGEEYETLEAFGRALEERGALRAGVGAAAQEKPLPSAARRDFRPGPGGAVEDRGVKFFVPWGLYATVGEWNFYLNEDRPGRIRDEHWYMTSEHRNRSMFRFIPRFNLEAKNVEAEDYAAGELEDWVAGALTFNGQDQYCVLSHKQATGDYSYSGGDKQRQLTGSYPGGKRKTVDMSTNNFLLEVYLKTRGGGPLVSKVSDRGYLLSVEGGRPVLRLLYDGGTVFRVGDSAIDDGEWHHLIGEVDRSAENGITLYIDGEPANGRFGGSMPAEDASLSNSADFYVGRGPEGAHFAGGLDFLRVCRGTLADARTTIEELYEWQFNGPFLRDFAGREPVGRRDAGAIEAAE